MSSEAWGACLALDTSGPLGSVAVAVSGEVLARAFLTEQSAHARLLSPLVRDVLDEAGVDREELRTVVVGKGPGSFTGVRVAAATAKGLVRGLGVPLRAYSSLAAGAVSAGVDVPPHALASVRNDGTGGDGEVLEPPARSEVRYILFDARGGRVYGACYRVDGDDIEEQVAPHAGLLDDVLRSGQDTTVRFAGSGALRHRERLAEEGFRVLAPPAGVPTADGLLRLLRMLPDRGRVEEPARWEPDYLRAWAGQGGG